MSGAQEGVTPDAAAARRGDPDPAADQNDITTETTTETTTGAMDAPIADIIELQQVLARYALGMSQDDIDAVIEAFTPDGTYSAFGSTYTLADFPALVAAAPKGLFLTGTPVLDLDPDTGTGTGAQTLCFVDQTTHDMRIGWYSDTYRRTDAGWRLHTRAMTFLRRSGARDSGKAHDPTRPAPSTASG